ncbi:class I SAM-dependent methyltransferase [Synechococcus sp. HK01-R]|uniref:class I SAM-dependent methyltransferase n=1 Tax=Synechococcus sp. HK01-R TaxID=2751171 RepID=UPI00162A64E7|nr:class I SAM-dependent methyltransferase [Synechococcus sp. HK01-R]QNG27898.1 class I SAM-dependent methyltransferase [Synechococcus sp. HK01-R]
MIKYDNHQSEWDRVLSDPHRAAVGESWMHSDTLDSFAHNRQRSPFLKLLNFFNSPSLLTLGDGRYGNDAAYFYHKGFNVHATDISDTLLSIGNSRGFIGDFSVQNAESIGFADQSFDFIFVKEALHHCPRPFLAISEMLRCAKVGVFISEPNDLFASMSPFLRALLFLYRCLKSKPYPRHAHEPVGNYMYSISYRDIEKACMGLHYHHLAFYPLNTTYSPGYEFIRMSDTSLRSRCIIFLFKAKLFFLDFLVRFRFMPPLITCAFIFKVEPPSQLVIQMQRYGWVFPQLPKNPYIN